MTKTQTLIFKNPFGEEVAREAFTGTYEQMERYAYKRMSHYGVARYQVA